MREPMSADLALSNIIDIAKERCNAEGHECDWECSLLDRSIAVVTAPAAGMPHTPAPGPRASDLSPGAITSHLNLLRDPIGDGSLDNRTARQALEQLERVMEENARYVQIINQITADNAGLTSCLDAVRAEAHQMLAEHGQSWNSISGRRILRVFDADPEMPRPAAPEPASGPQSVPGQSDKGTGVSGPENPAQADDPGESIADYVGRTTAEQAAALRPIHYREAAASLRAIADADEADGYRTYGQTFCDGIRFSARLLESAARDEEKA